MSSARLHTTTPTTPVRHPVREPQLFRFRLKQLLKFFALMSLLMTLLVTTPGPWPWCIGMLALLVAAHVYGTLIGTRLRDTSQEITRWRAADPAIDSDRPIATRQPVILANIDLPKSTTLAESSQHSRWRIWLILCGALLGATTGGIAIITTRVQPPGIPALAVGTFSCAVLGAWAAFLLSSFTTIARHAWRQAHGK